MKANELMLNDYVLYKGKIARVLKLVAINIIDVSTGIGTNWRPHEDVNPNDVCPVPLTAEILEKNGIKLEEVGDNGVSTPAKWRNRFEKWVLRTQWKDTFIWYDRTAKYWHLHDMGAAKLLYVHELQHALRLCGIEKEIEL